MVFVHLRRLRGRFAHTSVDLKGRNGGGVTSGMKVGLKGGLKGEVKDKMKDKMKVGMLPTLPFKEASATGPPYN